MKSKSLFVNELHEVYSVGKAKNPDMYHDTKLLLNVYNKVMWRMGESLTDIDEDCYDSDKKRMFELIDSLIDVDTQIDKSRFERRLHSIEESKSLIVLIDKALGKLRTYPGNGETYFHILNKIYILKNNIGISENELMETFNMSRSTLYREKKKAVTLLGVILWGFILPDIINESKNVRYA